MRASIAQTYTIPANVNREQRDISVPCEQTATPGLLITQSIEDWDIKHYKRPRWHVTQAGTGMKITGDSLTRPQARLIAGALGGLPIDWTQTSQEYFYKAALDVPKDLWHWLTYELRR
jgi:hypothetical protein